MDKTVQNTATPNSQPGEKKKQTKHNLDTVADILLIVFLFPTAWGAIFGNPYQGYWSLLTGTACLVFSLYRFTEFGKQGWWNDLLAIFYLVFGPVVLIAGILSIVSNEVAFPGILNLLS